MPAFRDKNIFTRTILKLHTLKIKFIYPLLLGTLLVKYASATQGDIDTTLIKAGKICPDFEINHINDFPSGKVTIDQLRGKWLLLDFWNKGCLSCVESFPTVNAQQHKFKNQLQYFLIGKNDQDDGTKKIYEKFKAKMNMEIPNAFDSDLFSKLQITGCPRIIVIQPDGIIYGTATHITDQDISDLITGKSPKLKDAFIEEATNNPDQHYLNDVDDKKDSSLVFKSALNKWNPSIKGSSYARITPQTRYFETIGNTLNQLYMLAYIGQDGVGKNDGLYDQMFCQPIIEVSDRNKFSDNINKNIYCYRLTVQSDKNNREEKMLMMQNDLKNYFGYEASIEKRIVPCWKITANKGAKTKLKTLGGAKSISGRRDTGLVFVNYPVKELVKKIYYIDLPVIDCTGIKGNIDLALKHLMTNLTDVQRNLEENGLTLIKGTTKMNALVIKDTPARQIMQLQMEKLILKKQLVR